MQEEEKEEVEVEVYSLVLKTTRTKGSLFSRKEGLCLLRDVGGRFNGGLSDLSSADFLTAVVPMSTSCPGFDNLLLNFRGRSRLQCPLFMKHCLFFFFILLCESEVVIKLLLQFHVIISFTKFAMFPVNMFTVARQLILKLAIVQKLFIHKEKKWFHLFRDLLSCHNKMTRKKFYRRKIIKA